MDSDQLAQQHDSEHEYDATLKCIEVYLRSGEGMPSCDLFLEFETDDGSRFGHTERWPSSDSVLDRMVELLKRLGLYEYPEWKPPSISSDPVGYRFRIRVVPAYWSSDDGLTGICSWGVKVLGLTNRTVLSLQKR